MRRPGWHQSSSGPQMHPCLLCCMTQLFPFSVSQFSFCVRGVPSQELSLKADRDSWELGGQCLITGLYLPFLVLRGSS